MKKDIVRVIISAILLVVIYFLPIDELPKLACYLLPYFLCGYETIFDAFKGIVKGELFDEKFLMTIATVGAFAIGEYPEAVFVMMFYQIGEIFEDLAEEKSRQSIRDLINVKDELVRIEKNGKISGVKPENINVGDIMLIKPGEKIAVDGIIVEGTTNLNTMVITGEAQPVAVGEGTEVYSGSINEDGLIKVKATKLLEESTATKILKLVEEAQENNAKSERFITRFARVYTPIVVGVAVLIVAIPSVIFGNFMEWFQRGLLFLVVSCPCALVISVPLAFFAGIGGASKRGILIKGANYLEALRNIDVLALDKTGTLTEGVFRIEEIKSDKVDEDELLALAARIEMNSNHPLAISIKKEYKKRTGNAVSEEIKLRDIAGKGVEATIGGDKYYAGTIKLMNEVGAKCPTVDTVGTIVYISKGSDFLGYITAADKIRDDAKNALDEIRGCGVSKIVMLTGDKRNVAEKVARDVGVDDVKSECLPQDKVNFFDNISGDGNGCNAFVGDGINDAPVIAKADIGFAMGAIGQDAAIEVADVVLMKDKLCKIATAIKISAKTNRIVWTNIIFAITIKILVMVLGAFGLAEMWHAIFADVGVTVLAVLNSMRALRIKER